MLIASKFPGSTDFRSEDFPKELEASLRAAWAELDRPVPAPLSDRGVDIPRLMDLLADASEAGKVKAVGVSNYSAEPMRMAHAALARRGIPLASNRWSIRSCTSSRKRMACWMHAASWELR